MIEFITSGKLIGAVHFIFGVEPSSLYHRGLAARLVSPKGILMNDTKIKKLKSKNQLGCIYFLIKTKCNFLQLTPPKYFTQIQLQPRACSLPFF